MCAVCEVVPYKRRKYKKNKRKGLIIFLSVLIFAFILIYLHLIFNIDPLIIKSSEQQIKVQVNNTVNNAAAKTFNNYSYQDFVIIEKDSGGNISLIQTDIVLINFIARNLALETQKNLPVKFENNISVPLGAFSGITLFAGTGADVKINVNSIGAVTYEYQSQFLSAGINQTLHKLLLILNTETELILPGGKFTVENKTEYLIAENIIVGKIPQIYFNNP